MEEYCKNNEIKFIRGRPYHPQSQGIVESFNKEIKRLLENKYLEAPKKFSIIMALPDIIEIYNNNIHSSTKLKPVFAFNLKNEKEINDVIDNIKKNNRKYKSNNVIKINTKCLLSENYELHDLRIKPKKLGNKGKYTIPCTIKRNNVANDYKITFPINYNLFKINTEYFVDYHLIVICQEKVWNKIFIILKIIKIIN